MQNPFVFWTTLVIFIIASFNLIVLLCRGRATDDHYLEVLSFTEWKNGETIMLELEHLLGESISISDLYVTLHRLTCEGIVEKRESHSEGELVLEFRKIKNKSGGRRHKIQLPLFAVKSPA